MHISLGFAGFCCFNCYSFILFVASIDNFINYKPTQSEQRLDVRISSGLRCNLLSKRQINTQRKIRDLPGHNSPGWHSVHVCGLQLKLLHLKSFSLAVTAHSSHCSHRFSFSLSFNLNKSLKSLISAQHKANIFAEISKSLIKFRTLHSSAVRSGVIHAWHSEGQTKRIMLSATTHMCTHTHSHSHSHSLTAASGS